ncbi:hypothetical protein D9611_003670 [Ephemerocybe angulata]|uniref:Uncharacterized protein n=1 Tax=Ephemerocybe angulata TaxID=980116 RepID=A0A8H5B5X1_9AGAR|nr:hypothetical protein D9611_003670 [Tulosesus angulatus]
MRYKCNPERARPPTIHSTSRLHPTRQMPPSDVPPPAPLKYDTEFYPDTVTFLTGDNVLFAVPKRPFLSGSSTFAKKYQIVDDRQTEHIQVNLSNPMSFPIKLEYDSEAFQPFCRVLCPMERRETNQSLTQQQWIRVLRLSILWNFNDIRQKAIDMMNLTEPKLSPFDKITLGKELNISAWLKSGYSELVTRGSSISLEEAQALGLQTAISLISIRESYLRSKYSKHGLPAALDEQIITVFQSEFDSIYLVEQYCMMPKDRGAAEKVRLKKVRAEEAEKREKECERLRAELAEKEKRQKKENEELAKEREALKALEAGVPGATKPATPAKVLPVPGTVKSQAGSGPTPDKLPSNSPFPSAAPSAPQPVTSAPVFPPNNSPFAALKQNTPGQGFLGFATQNAFSAGATSPFGGAPASAPQVPASNAPFSFGSR